MNKKLQAKDLINVGIFTAIYAVISMAVAMIGYIPIFIPLITVLVPFIGGIPFMLFLTRVKKFGMILIMSVIIGVLMALTGMGFWAIPTSIISGVLAELVYKAGDYRSARQAILCYGIFSLWLIGNFIPMVITRSSYFAGIESGFGEEYAATLSSYIPDWSLLPLLAACFVFGLLGGLLGRAVMKKHFIRAGIA
ncbi:MAG: MptD family putative ECF transporter S component [Lachnospiraceae bacterium]